MGKLYLDDKTKLLMMNIVKKIRYLMQEELDKSSLQNEEKIMVAHSILKDLHEESEHALKILGFEYWEE